MDLVTKVGRTSSRAKSARAGRRGAARASAAPFDTWVRAYVRAWRTDDPRAIGALFAKNARYATGPFDAPWRGRARIVEQWIARGDSQVRFRFRHEVTAVCGDLAVVEGRTTYAAADKLPERVFGNLWLVRLNRNGEAVEFREWWMQRR